MARNKKTFKPGESGNPGGRPKATPEQKAVKLLTRDQLVEVLSKAVRMKNCKLQRLYDDPNSDLTGLQRAAVGAVLKAGRTGEWGCIEPLISRVVGKIPDVIDTGGSLNDVIYNLVKNFENPKKTD